MISQVLKEKIEQYLQATISAYDLEEWVVPRQPFFMRFPKSDDADLVSTIDLGLVEMSHGIRTEEEFKLMLQEVLNSIRGVVIAFSLANTNLIENSSHNRTNRLHWSPVLSRHSWLVNNDSIIFNADRNSG